MTAIMCALAMDQTSESLSSVTRAGRAVVVRCCHKPPEEVSICKSFSDGQSGHCDVIYHNCRLSQSPPLATRHGLLFGSATIEQLIDGKRQQIAWGATRAWECRPHNFSSTSGWQPQTHAHNRDHRRQQYVNRVCRSKTSGGTLDAVGMTIAAGCAVDEDIQGAATNSQYPYKRAFRSESTPFPQKNCKCRIMNPIKNAD